MVRGVTTQPRHALFLPRVSSVNGPGYAHEVAQLSPAFPRLPIHNYPVKISTVMAFLLAVAVPAALSANSNRQRGGSGTAVTHRVNVVRGGYGYGSRGGCGYRVNPGYRFGRGYRRGYCGGYGYGLFVDENFYPYSYPSGCTGSYPSGYPDLYGQNGAIAVPVPTSPAPFYGEQVPPVPVPATPAAYGGEQVPPVPFPPDQVSQPGQADVASDLISIAQAQAEAAIAQLNLARAAADLATARLQQLTSAIGQSQRTLPTPTQPRTVTPNPNAKQQQDKGASAQPQAASGNFTEVDAALELLELIPIL